MGIKFKLHKDESTVDLSLRISSGENGWVIKAGAAPYLCFSEAEVLAALENIATQYLEQTKKTVESVAKKHLEKVR